MDILLFGANGQVGWELQRSLMPIGRLIACDRTHANFEDLDSLRQLVLEQKPKIIVNAAAYTAVDQAESNSPVARRINAEAVELLACEAKAIDAWLIHYSTDYVFDGKKLGAYNEKDEPNPLNVYGQTKLEGETLIQSSGCKHLIIRTSWVYATRGSNFVKTVLRLAQAQEILKFVSDQVGAPTSAELIADITAIALHQIIENQDLAYQYSGIYHLAASGKVSWHGFATYIIEQAKIAGLPMKTVLENIYPITTSEYPLPALRSANSVLNTNKLCDIFRVRLPEWELHVKRVLTELLQQGIL